MENQQDMNNTEGAGTAPSGQPEGVAPETTGGGSTREPSPTSDGGKKPLGPVIGIIIIIALIIIGGLYLWGGALLRPTLSPEEILNQEDAQREALMAQGTSDEVADIEEDLDATDLEDIDAELQQIEQELNNL